MHPITLSCCACVLALASLAQGEIISVPYNEIVELPPFVVTKTIEGEHWRYATIPGFEILTQCSASESSEIVASLWRGRQLVLPPNLWPHFSIPMTVILFNQPPNSPVNPHTFDSVRGPGEINRHWTNLIKRTIEDRESFALNLWGTGFTYSSTFRFDTRTLLYRRAPTAPLWLSEGLFGSYGLYREGVRWEPGDRQENVHVGTWHNLEETKKARKLTFAAHRLLNRPKRPFEPSALSPFLPKLETIFEQNPPTFDDPNYARWACTAALFVRWGIYGQKATEAARFWQFAEQACTMPLSEEIFRGYFGQSYADVRAELSWYMVIALSEEGLAPITVVPPPKLTFRDATGEEIARLRGEWERIEAYALAKQFPELAASYREQAARTLNYGYNRGSRNPQLLASLGLLALDSGNLKLASQYLETAVAGHAIGPRVYLEAARLRWATGRIDNTGTLSAETRAGIIDLLLIAEQQAPSMASVYLLLATAVAQSGAATPAQTAALQRGCQYFPFNAALQNLVNTSIPRAPREPSTTREE